MGSQENVNRAYIFKGDSNFDAPNMLFSYGASKFVSPCIRTYSTYHLKCWKLSSRISFHAVDIHSPNWAIIFLKILRASKASMGLRHCRSNLRIITRFSILGIRNTNDTNPYRFGSRVVPLSPVVSCRIIHLLVLNGTRVLSPVK